MFNSARQYYDENIKHLPVFQLSEIIPALKKKIKTKADAVKVAEALKGFEQERVAYQPQITAALSQMTMGATQSRYPERL